MVNGTFPFNLIGIRLRKVPWKEKSANARSSNP